MVYKVVGNQVFYWEDDTYKLEGTYKDRDSAMVRLGILRGEIVPLGEAQQEADVTEVTGQSGTLTTETKQQRKRSIVSKRRVAKKK